MSIYSNKFGAKTKDLLHNMADYQTSLAGPKEVLGPAI